MQQTQAAGQWIWLQDMQDIIYIESGEVEIYVVHPKTGVRKFLLAAGTGSFLCGLEAEGPLRLLAIVTLPAALKSYDWQTLYRESSFVEKFARLLHVFFCRPKPPLLPRVFTEPIPSTRQSFPAGTELCAGKNGLCWLELLSGSVVQSEKLTKENFLVLSDTETITLAKDGEVAAYGSGEIARAKPLEFFLSCLSQESRRFSKCYEAFFLSEEETFRQRLTEKEQEKELLVGRAYRELMKNLIPDLPVVLHREDKTQPDAIYALQQIGAFFGIKKRRIRLSAEFCHVKDSDEIIRLISGPSGLYGRRVLLENGWQKRDQGPLLVFMNEQPFAALPSSPSRYELLDLANGQRIFIDEAFAKKLSPKAYSFHRGMPEAVNSLWKWLGWIGRMGWKRDYWTLFFCCLFVGFLPVLTPLITQTIFDDIIPSYDKQAHLMVIQVMLVTSLAGSFTALARGVCVMRLKYQIRRMAEPALWIRLLSLPSSFFRRYQIGDLALRMQGISQISAQSSSLLSNGIFNGLFCFFNLIVMFYFSYKLSLLVCLLWSVYFAGSLFFSRRLLKFQRRKLSASGASSGQVVQLLAGLSKFKVQAAEERAFYLWTRKFGDEWHWNRRSRWQRNWLELLGQSRSLVLNFFLFLMTMNLFDESIKTGTEFLSQANFLSFNAAMGSFGVSVAGLLGGVTDVMGIAPQLERIKPILTEPPEVTERKLPAGELRGNFEISDVSFRYREELPLVLKNVSLRVEAGTFLAIVGSSGSGKSTLLRVLLGLEKPEKGMVQYDGQDLDQLDVTSVRRQIGVVMQNGRIMAGNIYSNIVGALPLSLDDAWEAAKLVGLDGDIRDMPMGMHTLIGESGGNLSGGQKQRILIARSIVNRPRLVVFDEATSALDNATQAIVSQTLEKLQSTRIIVAHRLSTIRNADRIIVMEKGEIAESGTYDELMAHGGLFKELAQRQIV